MKLIIMFLSSIFLLLCFNVHGDTLNNVNDLKQLCDNTMHLIVNNRIDEAIEQLKPYWFISSREIDNLSKSVNELILRGSKRFGEPLGYEYIVKTPIGRSLIQYVYLLKYEKHALYCTIIMYKPKEEWLINSLFINDNLEHFFTK